MISVHRNDKLINNQLVQRFGCSEPQSKAIRGNRRMTQGVRMNRFFAAKAAAFGLMPSCNGCNMDQIKSVSDADNYQSAETHLREAMISMSRISRPPFAQMQQVVALCQFAYQGKVDSIKEAENTEDMILRNCGSGI